MATASPATAPPTEEKKLLPPWKPAKYLDLPTNDQYVHIKAVNPIPEKNQGQVSVFLAGSIEMGKAELWQDTFAAGLRDMPINVLNPRRPDWDKEWNQDPDFGHFREQVDWEMDHLNDCDVIALNFDPATLSPISLLELGLHAGDNNKVVVCCPKKFWRSGNVKVVCSRYGLTVVETKDELLEEVRTRLSKAMEARNFA